MPFLALDRIQTRDRPASPPEPRTQGRTVSQMPDIRYRMSDIRCRTAENTGRPARPPEDNRPSQDASTRVQPTRRCPRSRVAAAPDDPLVGLTSSPCQRTGRQTPDDNRRMTIAR